MTLTLPLTTIRDLLTNFESSAALKAARYFETRQLYFAQDWAVTKRVLPAEFGRALRAADPDGLIFHIDFKSIPKDLVDQWTPTPEYCVVCAAQDWPHTVEYQLTRSTYWQEQQARVFAQSAEADRVFRMAKAIMKKIPGARAVHDVLIAEHKRGEQFLRDTIAHFERATLTQIYEAPTGTQETNRDLSPAPAHDAGDLQEERRDDAAPSSDAPESPSGAGQTSGTHEDWRDLVA